MSHQTYLHGFDEREQQRLVAQAEHWREALIPRDLDYRSGERVLELGCAVGATLAVLGERFPGIRVAGIDLEPRQVAFAREHLASRGIAGADLRVGDVCKLPWPEDTFHHVFMMWFLDHVSEGQGRQALAEARRVLRPGGTITLTEAENESFYSVHPDHEDWAYLVQAQYDHFARFGNVMAGRTLGVMLARAGFAEVTSRALGFHFFQGGGEPGALRRHVEYLAGFLEPEIPRLAEDLGRDPLRLQRGVDHLRSIPDHPMGAITFVVYRAQARGPRASGYG